ncbi:hypothetical protein Pelo_13720 [Pelomyxa schiedti]|nr:hypothetical protein Pelo_13720 [Pelomyxa schiedti]
MEEIEVVANLTAEDKHAIDTKKFHLRSSHHDVFIDTIRAQGGEASRRYRESEWRLVIRGHYERVLAAVEALLNMNLPANGIVELHFVLHPWKRQCFIYSSQYTNRYHQILVENKGVKIVLPYHKDDQTATISGPFPVVKGAYLAMMQALNTYNCGYPLPVCSKETKKGDNVTSVLQELGQQSETLLALLGKATSPSLTEPKQPECSGGTETSTSTQQPTPAEETHNLPKTTQITLPPVIQSTPQVGTQTPQQPPKANITQSHETAAISTTASIKPTIEPTPEQTTQPEMITHDDITPQDDPYAEIDRVLQTLGLSDDLMWFKIAHITDSFAAKGVTALMLRDACVPQEHIKALLVGLNESLKTKST